GRLPLRHAARGRARLRWRVTDVLDLSASVTEDQRALLQRRVAGFALAVGAFTFATLGARLLVVAYWTPASALTPPEPRWLHAAAGASLLAIWLLTRSGRRSARFVRIAEALGLLGAALCIHAIAYLMTSHLVGASAMGEL